MELTESDSVCGTIVEFRQQLRKQLKGKDLNINMRPKKERNRGSHLDNNYGDDVYGVVKMKGVVGGGGRATTGRGSATGTLRDTFKNYSQKKHEFLHKLQEEENLRNRQAAGFPSSGTTDYSLSDR